MLALRSYEQQSGFSIMEMDELFFINGGSDEHAGDTRAMIPSDGFDQIPPSQEQANHQYDHKPTIIEKAYILVKAVITWFTD